VGRKSAKVLAKLQGGHSLLSVSVLRDLAVDEFVIIFIRRKEQDHIRVLLNGTGFSEIRECGFSLLYF
jgi:DNA-binding SARP family transcriptional activator